MISSLCQNNKITGGAGRRGEEKLIEQNVVFVQLRGERAGGGGYFESYFDKEKFPLLSHFLRLRGELLFVNLNVS